MSRTKGATDKKPRAKNAGMFTESAKPTGRTEPIAGRVSPAVRDYLEAEGRSLNWGERIEKAVQRLIRLDKVSQNTNNGDDFAF